MNSLIAYLRWSPELEGALYVRRHVFMYAITDFASRFQDQRQTLRLGDYFRSL